MRENPGAHSEAREALHNWIMEIVSMLLCCFRVLDDLSCQPLLSGFHKLSSSSPGGRWPLSQWVELLYLATVLVSGQLSVWSFLGKLVTSIPINYPRHLSAVSEAEVLAKVVSAQGKGRGRTNTMIRISQILFEIIFDRIAHTIYTNLHIRGEN